MKPGLLAILICPDCQSSLDLYGDENEKGEIVSGSLRCKSCPRIFPIKEGIPVLLSSRLQKTIEGGQAAGEDQDKGTLQEDREIRLRDKEAGKYLSSFTNHETEIECRNVLRALKITSTSRVIEVGAGVGRITKNMRLTPVSPWLSTFHLNLLRN